MIAILGSVVVVLGLSVTWPVTKELFRFGPLHLDNLGLALGSGIAGLAALEAIKPPWTSRNRQSYHHELWTCRHCASLPISWIRERDSNSIER